MKFDNLKKNKKSYLYLVIIIITLIIIAILFFSNNPVTNQKITQNNVTNTTSNTSSFYSEINIPSDFSINEDKEGKGLSDGKIHTEVLVSPDQNLTITLVVTPTESANDIKTGAPEFNTPDPKFLERMEKVTTIEGIDLYRENAEDKLYEIFTDNINGSSSGDQVNFVLYAKTADPNFPYQSVFRTSRNAKVEINMSITYTGDTQTYYNVVKQMDTILKSIKV